MGINIVMDFSWNSVFLFIVQFVVIFVRWSYRWNILKAKEHEVFLLCKVPRLVSYSERLNKWYMICISFYFQSWKQCLIWSRKLINVLPLLNERVNFHQRFNRDEAEECTVGKVLALHATNQGLILCTLCSTAENH